jgi:anti-sigma-K factor RskA
MSERESLQDLAADYALGLLGPEETAAFEQELAQSPGLQFVVREYREALALLPATADAPPPAADLKGRVLAKVGGRGVEAAAESEAVLTTGDVPALRVTRDASVITPLPTPRGTPVGVWLALAASLLAAAGLGYQWRTALRAGQEGAAREAALHASIDSVSRLLAAREATLAAILTPGIELHVLKSTGAPEPGIDFFWNRKQHQGLLYAFNLPASAKGRTYQLWMIEDGKPVPSVTFAAGADGHSLVGQIAMPTDASGVQALAVTDEPTGGSPAPTTPVLLLASIGS